MNGNARNSKHGARLQGKSCPVIKITNRLADLTAGGKSAPSGVKICEVHVDKAMD